MIESAHARNLRILMDLVLNHTSDRHPWFQAARSDRNSPHREYYVWSDSDEKYADRRIIFPDTEKSNWTWDEKAGQYFWHRFYAHQPDLYFEHPKVQQEMLDIARFWLAMGIDGFRADAVPYLFEREGTNCENLPAAGSDSAFIDLFTGNFRTRQELSTVQPNSYLWLKQTGG